MKSECTLVCHLGLGDLILLSGLACWLLEQYETVYFPAPQRYLTSVRSFFLLQPRVKVFVAGPYPKPYDFPLKGDIIRTGFYGYDKEITLPVRDSKSFAENFYWQAGAPYEVRWDYCPINQVVEQFYKARWHNHPCYNFIHDDRRFGIDTRRFHNQLFVLPRESSTSILSNVPTIIHAREIHVIDSCFMHLVESLELINHDQRLVYHRYARPVRKNLYEDGRWNDVDVPSRKNWEVLN